MEKRVISLTNLLFMRYLDSFLCEFIDESHSQIIIILFKMQTNRAVLPEGKVVYYRSDGTGRDTYIRNHNGGLLTKDFIHKAVQFKPPRERNLTFSKTKYGKQPY